MSVFECSATDRPTATINHLVNMNNNFNHSELRRRAHMMNCILWMTIWVWVQLSAAANECEWVRVRISVFTWQSLLFYCDLLAMQKRERGNEKERHDKRRATKRAPRTTAKNFHLGKLVSNCNCNVAETEAGAGAAVVALPHWDNERSLPNCCAAQECGMCGKVAKQEAIDKCNSSSSSQENENLLSENEGKPRVLVSRGSSSSSNNCSCNSNKAIELPLCCCCSLWLLTLLLFPSLLWLFLCLPQRVASTIATASAAVALSLKLLSICGSIEQRSKQQL